ncbi:unnamed protein product, partial [Symbiodinium sp. KB8]
MSLTDQMQGIVDSELFMGSMVAEQQRSQADAATIRRAQVLAAATRDIPDCDLVQDEGSGKPRTPPSHTAKSRHFFSESDAASDFASSRRRAAADTTPPKITAVTASLSEMFGSPGGGEGYSTVPHRRVLQSPTDSAAGTYVTPMAAPGGMSQEALVAAFPHAQATLAERRNQRQLEQLLQRVAEAEAKAAAKKGEELAKAAAEAARVRASHITAEKVEAATREAAAKAKAARRAARAVKVAEANPKPAPPPKQQAAPKAKRTRASMTPLDRMSDSQRAARKDDSSGVVTDVIPDAKPTTAKAESKAPSKPPPPTAARGTA